jgi:hypothetical protein
MLEGQFPFAFSRREPPFEGVIGQIRESGFGIWIQPVCRPHAREVIPQHPGIVSHYLKDTQLEIGHIIQQGRGPEHIVGQPVIGHILDQHFIDLDEVSSFDSLVQVLQGMRLLELITITTTQKTTRMRSTKTAMRRYPRT